MDTERKEFPELRFDTPTAVETHEVVLRHVSFANSNYEVNGLATFIENVLQLGGSGCEFEHT